MVSAAFVANPTTGSIIPMTPIVATHTGVKILWQLSILASSPDVIMVDPQQLAGAKLLGPKGPG